MAALSIRASVELTVKPVATSMAKQTRLLKVVCLELDWTRQSISGSTEKAVCREASQEVKRDSRANSYPKNSVKYISYKY